MASASKKPPVPKNSPAPLREGTNPLADIEGGPKDYQRKSSDLIYESIMRGGGEPFGAPLGIGVSTLTERIVKLFKQRSFFAFETLEKKRKARSTNKFTKYGAANYRGTLQQPRKNP